MTPRAANGWIPTVAEFLFRFDPSSAADYSYDAWIAEQVDHDRFSTEDVRVLNRTMAARSPYAAWSGLVDQACLGLGYRQSIAAGTCSDSAT